MGIENCLLITIEFIIKIVYSLELFCYFQAVNEFIHLMQDSFVKSAVSS